MEKLLGSHLGRGFDSHHLHDIPALISPPQRPAVHTSTYPKTYAPGNPGGVGIPFWALLPYPYGVNASGRGVE